MLAEIIFSWLIILDSKFMISEMGMVLLGFDGMSDVVVPPKHLPQGTVGSAGGLMVGDTC